MVPILQCLISRFDDEHYLYGVFDGHDGMHVADFARLRLPAELLFGQLMEIGDDDVVKKVLFQAFNTVDLGYFESIDGLLAERTNLKLQLPEVNNNIIMKGSCIDPLQYAQRTHMCLSCVSFWVSKLYTNMHKRDLTPKITRIVQRRVLCCVKKSTAPPCITRNVTGTWYAEVMALFYAQRTAIVL